MQRAPRTAWAHRPMYIVSNRQSGPSSRYFNFEKFLTPTVLLYVPKVSSVRLAVCGYSHGKQTLKKKENRLPKSFLVLRFQQTQIEFTYSS